MVEKNIILDFIHFNNYYTTIFELANLASSWYYIQTALNLHYFLVRT